MNESFNPNPERIPTKAEILEVLGRYSGPSVFEREKSDGKGICLLEVRVTNPETGEISEYSYMRKGKLTSIHVAYYEGEMPIGGDILAELNPQTGKWEDAKGMGSNR